MTLTDNRLHPCNGCPWLASNQGKPHPDGWYTKRNLSRLWSGMRRGEHMSCHPTDSDNPVSDRAKEQGYKEAPEGAGVLQCVGAVIATQREYMVLQDVHKGDLKAYRAARPRGLTRDGIKVVIADFLFGGTYFSGGGQRMTPDLNSQVTVPGCEWPVSADE